jgi:hypothetical protein
MSPAIVTTGSHKKSPLRQFFSTGAAIPSPTASRPQVQAAEQAVQLAIVQFDALLVIANAWELKSAGFQPFVPNAKSILIPEQDFDSIAITIEEQEQVP